MLKAILYDYGGTLTDGGVTGNFVRTLAKKTGLPKAHLLRIFEQHNHAYLIGKMSGPHFWALYAQHTGVSLTPKELSRLFVRSGRAEPNRLALVRKLHARYKTALISDNYQDLADDIIPRYHLNDLFDVLILSNQEGIRKPDHRMFTRALTRLGVRSSECVFIDDKKRIVEAAREVGLKSILFVGQDKLKRSLEKMGYEGL